MIGALGNPEWRRKTLPCSGFEPEINLNPFRDRNIELSRIDVSAAV
jgi:hypothetical protein